MGEKKIISTTPLNYSYLKKIAHLYTKLLLLLLKTVRQKTRSQDCETNKFFFTYSVTDSYYGEKLSSVSVFFILKLLKTKQKQKLYLLKNDILLSDILRYYHRLKQTNVKKQTNTKKLNKCTTLTTKNCDTYMCANFCFETPLPH